MRIGKFIAGLRKENLLTQEQFADKIGVTDKSIRWIKRYPRNCWISFNPIGILSCILFSLGMWLPLKIEYS